MAAEGTEARSVEFSGGVTPRLKRSGPTGQEKEGRMLLTSAEAAQPFTINPFCDSVKGLASESCRLPFEKFLPAVFSIHSA